MVDPYLGEIRMVAGKYAPSGWAICNGQLVLIQENSTLFALITTTYGGDGVTNFALPDLRSRVPVHQGTLSSGTTFPLGATGGTETEVLAINQIPSHTHSLRASSKPGTASSPAGTIPAGSTDSTPYSTTVDTTMNATMLSVTGANQPHENMLPFLPINFIISLTGTAP